MWGARSPMFKYSAGQAPWETLQMKREKPKLADDVNMGKGRSGTSAGTPSREAILYRKFNLHRQLVSEPAAGAMTRRVQASLSADSSSSSSPVAEGLRPERKIQVDRAGHPKPQHPAGREGSE